MTNRTLNSEKNMKEKQRWGFHSYSEKLNGRLAMVGIIFIIVSESYTKEKCLSYMFSLLK